MFIAIIVCQISSRISFHSGHTTPTFETRHEKTNILRMQKQRHRLNREADQHLCFCCRDSTIPLLSKSKISSLQPSSVLVQLRLSWTCLENHIVGFLMK